MEGEEVDENGCAQSESFWTDLSADGGDNQIALSWDAFEAPRPGFKSREGCEDDPDICIWNSWYYDFDNQEDCEANNGIWGSYLEYFGTSCSEMISSAGCDNPVLYWTVSDLCPESCGGCVDGCTDLDACNYNSDATDDDGSCIYPEEYFDCDGNCIVEIDCNDECGGSAVEDECGECEGDGSSCNESTVSLEIQNVDLDNGLLDIYMINSEEVGGFQIELIGVTITDATAPNGFMVSTSPSTILAFSLTGATIPVGEGVLTQVSFSSYYGDDICFGEDTGSAGSTAISGVGGVYIAADWGECYGIPIIIGCMDLDACNYNPDATEPDDCWEFDCNGDCGGSATPQYECLNGTLVCSSSECDDGLVAYNVYRDGILYQSGITESSFNDIGLGYSESHCYTVTYTYGSDFESEHSNEACAVTNPEPVITGCTDPNACNYNEEANEDDGTCILPEENFDCEGNCTVEIDCNNVCGGSEIEDECGDCGGHGPSINCWDGELVCSIEDCNEQLEDSPFNFNQSSSQAFYYLFNATDINGNPLVAGEDWIGVFNGDVCVGAREWSDEITTDIPAMGDDGFWYSEGYLQVGDYPEFQIYDGSEDLYYEAHPSEIFAFANNGVFSINNLTVGIDYTLELRNYHNLVSFYALPEDVSIANMTFELGNNALSVIGEGSSALNIDGEWVGSLEEISGESGYWVSVENFPVNLAVMGYDIDPDRLYELHVGPNLISFPVSGSADLSSAIPDEVEHLFTAIISEGISALNTENGWVGSLTGFQGGEGYWVIVEEYVSFIFNTEDLLARSLHTFSEVLPDNNGYVVAQSSRQAFYFVDDIQLEYGVVEIGDWLLSYNNDVLAGIRQWKGGTVDIPSMGYAGDVNTSGYFKEREVPTFKLLKQSTGKLISLEGDVPGWINHGIFNLGELKEKSPMPDRFVLESAYPNPFNPVTTIGFGLPDQSEIVVEIFNLNGKRVETLVNGVMSAGYKTISWNADHHSSGLYFVKISAQTSNGTNFTSTQKLLLVK